MKNIAFIIPSFDEGGTENYVLRFIKNDPTNYYYLISLSSSEGSLKSEYLDTGATLVFLPLGYLNIKNLFRLSRFFKKNKITTVVSFNGNFSGLALLIAFINGIKTRIAFYRRSRDAFNPTLFKKIYNRFANQLVKAFATKILGNSKEGLDYFFQGKIDKERFDVVPNGVDGKSFNLNFDRKRNRQELSIDDSCFVIGHVGRYTKVKNHKFIFELAKKLKQKKLNFKLLFCGRNTDSLEFKRELELYEIEDVTITLGVRKDIPKILSMMDIFIFPSFNEGQPNALIEAMISGIPVFASNIPPIKECTPLFYHINLFDPTKPLQLVKKIEEIIHNEIDSKSVCELKKWAVNHFDHKKRFSQFLSYL